MFPIPFNFPFRKKDGSITTINKAIEDGSTLPIASANKLGGIKVGNNLSIDENGKLSASAGGSIYTHYVHFSRGTGSGDANGTIIIVRNNDTAITKDDIWDMLYNNGTPITIDCINGTRGTNAAAIVYGITANLSGEDKQFKVNTLSGTTTIAYNLLTFSDIVFT